MVDKTLHGKISALKSLQECSAVWRGIGEERTGGEVIKEEEGDIHLYSKYLSDQEYGGES